MEAVKKKKKSVAARGWAGREGGRIRGAGGIFRAVKLFCKILTYTHGYMTLYICQYPYNSTAQRTNANVNYGL